MKLFDRKTLYPASFLRKPYKPKQANFPFKVYLGTTLNRPKRIYLTGFKWECNWYWGGGYIGNRNLHCHFDGCFLDCPDSRGHSLGNFYDPWTKLPNYLQEKDVKRISNGAAVWEDITFFLDDVPEHIKANWWRIKDLYKQFYKLKEAAETFQYGGHCTSQGRNEQEINQEMADNINKHIELIIIPEIIKVVCNES